MGNSWRKSREALHLSEGFACRHLGMDEARLARIEAGAVAPTDREREQMARLYGIRETDACGQDMDVSFGAGLSQQDMECARALKRLQRGLKGGQ